MDITAFLELKPAPRAIFDALPERKTRPRFMLPTTKGDWAAVTWGAYAKGIRQAALFLASAGLQSGDRAAIFAPNSVEWISAAMAIQAVGVVDHVRGLRRGVRRVHGHHHATDGLNGHGCADPFH